MYKYYLIIILTASFLACSKTELPQQKPLIILKTGSFTKPNAEIPIGGKLSFGITAIGGSAALTNLRIVRIADDREITEFDKGYFITENGLDYTLNAVKSKAKVEIWKFTVMNANRDTASTSLTVLLGAGSAYGEIIHIPTVKIGMQSNVLYPNYLDLHNGTAFTSANALANDALIDMVGFVYQTSGIMSPTPCCPAYSGSSSVTGFYPAIGNWINRNSTLYDYNSSDNNLVSAVKFDLAKNDSLLVSAYQPASVSGLSKYAFTGKIVPFKTADGKYGLLKVKHADVVETGYMELEIKVQK